MRFLAHDRRGAFSAILLLIHGFASLFPSPVSVFRWHRGCSDAFFLPDEKIPPPWFLLSSRGSLHFFLHPDAAADNLSRPIPSRMARNNSRGTATCAIWKIICREWRTAIRPLCIASRMNHKTQPTATATTRTNNASMGQARTSWPTRRGNKLNRLTFTVTTSEFVAWFAPDYASCGCARPVLRDQQRGCWQEAAPRTTGRVRSRAHRPDTGRADDAAEDHGEGDLGTNDPDLPGAFDGIHVKAPVWR